MSVAAAPDNHSLNRLLAALLTLGSCIFLAGLLYHHYRLVTAVVPLDRFEPAMSYFTDLLLSGANPYAGDLQPRATSVYPPLYNLLVVPVAAALGNTLPVHRAVAALFLLGCCGLFYGAGRRLGLKPGYVLAATALLYAGLLYHNTPVAGVNSLGLLLFLLCLWLPWFGNYSRPALLASALLGVLAFYGKQYFVAAPAFVCVYLALRFTPRAAALYAAVFAAAFLALTAAVVAGNPYFLDQVLFAPSEASRFSTSTAHLLRQLKHYGALHAALFAALALTWLLGRRAAPPRPRAPEFRYLCLSLALATALIVASLGRNRGNDLTYWFQLVSPFLLLALFHEFDLRSRRAALVQLPLILPAFLQFWTLLDGVPQVDHRGWRKVDRLVASHQRMLVPPYLWQLMLEHDKPSVDGPLSAWFHFAAMRPAWTDALSPAADTRAVSAAHITRINRLIGEEWFDLILLEKGKWGVIGAAPTTYPFGGSGRDAFRRHYRLRETVRVELPERPGGGWRVVEVWEPAHAVRAPGTQRENPVPDSAGAAAGSGGD